MSATSTEPICGPGKRYPSIQLHVAHLNHKLRGRTGISRYSRRHTLCPVVAAAYHYRCYRCTRTGSPRTTLH